MQQVKGPSKKRGTRSGEPEKRVFDFISEMVSLHDSDFNIIRANLAVAKTVGLDLDQLVGRKCYEVFHGTSEPPPHCPHKKATITRTSVTEDFYEPKLGKHLLISVTPITNRSDKPVQSFHIGLDITKLKETERLLEEARNHLEELVGIRTEALDKANKLLKAEIEERKRVENELRKREETLAEAQMIAHVGSFEWNMRTNDLTGSTEAQNILGLSLPEVSFETILKMIVPDQREGVLEAVKAAIDNSTGRGEVEFAVNSQKDKQKRFLRVRARVAMDKRHNQPLLMRGVLWDITAQKEAQAELRARGEALLESQNELRGLAAKLMLKEQGESRRLAIELKSIFEQRLGAVLSETRRLRNYAANQDAFSGSFQSLQKDLQKILSDTRRISKQLYPSEVEKEGLANAIREKCRSLSTKTMDISFQCDCKPELPPYMAVSLYRVVEECLSNAARHARATNVRVCLNNGKDSISLIIQDDGIGFNPTAVRKTRQGLGLSAMEERVRLMRGRLSIECEPQQGTAIHIEVPSGDQIDRQIASRVIAPQLSKRQIEVVQQLAEGFAAKEIGVKLGISSKAVEFHKYRVMKILGIRTAAELIRFAVKTGLV